MSHSFVEYGGRHQLPTASATTLSSSSSLTISSATALEAVESGLRRSIINQCVDQRCTLLTYFVASEEQEYLRDRLHDEELQSRCELKIEELENIERTHRFDILFEAECEWETLTGRLGAESFSMVTRRVVEDLERRQFLTLAKELTQEREYVHRCEIMADGLLPGFIREQESFIKNASQDLSQILIDECVEREELIRGDFLTDAPLLSSFAMQREEIDSAEAIHRTHLIEIPFFEYIDITKKIRDEFAAFWNEQLLRYHEHIAVSEEEVYQQVLLEEESVCREFDLVPGVVGGLEEIWREEDIERPEIVERNDLEVQEVLEKEVVWRSAFPEREQQQSREQIQLLFEFSELVWGTLFPEWRKERKEMLDEFENLIQCALVSQRCTLEFLAIGSRRGIISQWSESVFKTAQSALLEQEDLVRFEQEVPYFDLEELFALEAEELHTRHSKILTAQIDQVYKIYQKAIIREEFTARQYIVDVEWENGIIFMYASFHRLWLETVTMGVTRNALKREWERETLVMHEVWVRLRIAAKASFALDSEVMGQVRDFMPDFDEVAAPLPDEDEEEGENQQDCNNSSPVKKSKRALKKEQDINALPSVFYIGEDPFGNSSGGGQDPSHSTSRRSTHHHQPAPPPPQFGGNNNHQITPGIVVRFKQHPRRSHDLPNLDEDPAAAASSMNSSTRPPGRFGRSINNNKSLESVFASPTLNAAAGSVWISPETFDVISIRATLKVLGKTRNHAFALLTQFFQITHRKHLESKYDEWLEGYGDMGYWAHAIEVGLLNQLHSLDEDFVEQTDRTRNIAIRRGSPQFKNQADDDLSNFVHERDIKLSHQRTDGRKRTVIDALRESLRQPARPSQRKLKPVSLAINPEMMCPRPKSSFEDWSPSRMTPDEFAHYEHNLILRSAGVEKTNEEAFSKGKNSSSVTSTALPTSRNGDPGWSIFQRSSQHHYVPHYARKQQQQHHSYSTTRSQHHHHSHHRHHYNNEGNEQEHAAGDEDDFAADNDTYIDDGRNSPGNRIDSTVRFKNTRPASAQTIPRLAPSRLSDHNHHEDSESATKNKNIPHARRHHDKSVGSIPHSQKRKSKSDHHHHHHHRSTISDPNVEDRRLQFNDIFNDDENTAGHHPNVNRPHSSRASKKASPNRSLKNPNNSRNNNNFLSEYESRTLRDYKKVLSRTESSQRSVPESTSEFLHKSMRPISLIVRPTPPPTPTPLGGVMSPRKQNNTSGAAEFAAAAGGSARRRNY